MEKSSRSNVGTGLTQAQLQAAAKVVSALRVKVCAELRRVEPPSPEEATPTPD